MTRLVTLLVAGLLVAPAAQAQSGTFDCNVLDFGIYWYGLGNVSQKAVPGVANPYYVATRPTVIYVHGWQQNSAVNRRRETFNYQWNDATYGVNVNMADAWIRAGWNIGIFYWNQFADEGEVKDAEAKIHTNLGPQGMRWRRCDGTYTTAGSPTVGAAQLFYNAIVANMGSFSGTHLRIAGHSLGSQMAVNVTRLLSDAVGAGRINSRLRPTRVALLDPFWSNGSKSYLNGLWPGELARNHVNHLRSVQPVGVIFERYKSSNINDFFIGDSNQGLTTMIGQTELIPGWIPNTNQSARHVAAYNMYFRSFAFTPPPECSTDAFGNRTCAGTAASASTSDSQTRWMMNSSFQWIQTAGTLTELPSDNMFDRRAR